MTIEIEYVASKSKRAEQKVQWQNSFFSFIKRQMSGKLSRLVNARIIFHLRAPEAIWTKATVEIKCRSRFSESISVKSFRQNEMHTYSHYRRICIPQWQWNHMQEWSTEKVIDALCDIYMLFFSELLLICVLNSVKQTGLLLWFGRSDRQIIFTCIRYQFSSRCSAAPNSILNRVIICFRTEDLNSRALPHYTLRSLMSLKYRKIIK